jgi:hypothetical protein
MRARGRRLIFLSLATALGAGALCAQTHFIDLPRLDPALPTTEDEVTLRLAGFTECPGALGFQEPEVAGRRILARGFIATFAPCQDFGPFRAALPLGRLTAGDWVVEVSINHGTPTTLAFAVTSPATELRLRGGAFIAALGSARAVTLSDDSGYFWFYDPGNVEVTLKVLDGEAVNGQPWIFLASMTDRPFTLVVIDNRTGCYCADCLAPPTCPVWVHVNPTGLTRNVIDLAPFD